MFLAPIVSIFKETNRFIEKETAADKQNHSKD